MNNEPIELARVELAGLLGRNPREGKYAKRAVVLIDPFVEPDEPGPASDHGLLNAVFGLFKSWIEQCRCKHADLALAKDETIYSRFLVSPSRGEGRSISNGFNVASSLLSGFGGFLDECFRRHDYLLGRRNCQNFLREHFKLPAENHLFDGWNSELRSDKRYMSKTPNGVAELPVIPLMDCLWVDQGLPVWPKVYTRQKLENLLDQIGQRADGVFKAAIQKFCFAKRWAMKFVWYCGGKSLVLGKAKSIIEADLKRKELM